MAEIIYVLTNESMPNLVKIGLTQTDLQQRIDFLYNGVTGVPLPFNCYFAAEVEDAIKLEKKLHQLFAENRINPKREFFKVDPERIVLAITIGRYKEITPGVSTVDNEEIEAANKARAKRPNINLAKIGIHEGSVLNFSRDGEISCIVRRYNKVLYDGKLTSLSDAASKALVSLGYKSLSVSGSEYWMYEGETLDERRRRLETEKFGEKE